MTCEAIAEYPEESTQEEPTSYIELCAGHIISSNGDQYVKVRGFEEEPEYYMWTELVSIEEDTLFCRVMRRTPEDSEYELEAGDIITCTQQEEQFIYVNKVQPED